MATRQGKKVKVRVRNLFSRRGKKSSRPKDHVRLLEESEEPMTTLGEYEEENEELNLILNLEVNQKTKSQPKRRSVKLDVGDLLYGGQGGQPDRETEPVSSGHMAAGSRREEGTRPGKDRDLDLRLVTKDDGEDTSLSDAETTGKEFSTRIHSEIGTGGKTQPGKNVRNFAKSDVGNLARPGKDKKGEGKSKKKRKKVTFSPTSTKYIQMEDSQEALDVYVMEEQTIKKKKSRKKKIKKRIRKAARLSWRYLVAGFQNMWLVTPFYVTTDTMQSTYSPQYNTSLVTPMYMTSYIGEDGYIQRYP
ncbi:uncharacterized protein [Branchiostoma lanceolatum]|uniref:uncharacterized protein n=1 Tax=Branchiostoma lanceolatum TaxID=7740 RepID=UPI003451944C